jgi:hypothetical protein
MKGSKKMFQMYGNEEIRHLLGLSPPSEVSEPVQVVSTIHPLIDLLFCEMRKGQMFEVVNNKDTALLKVSGYNMMRICKEMHRAQKFANSVIEGVCNQTVLVATLCQSYDTQICLQVECLNGRATIWLRLFYFNPDMKYLRYSKIEIQFSPGDDVGFLENFVKNSLSVGGGS